VGKIEKSGRVKDKRRRSEREKGKDPAPSHFSFARLKSPKKAVILGHRVGLLERHTSPRFADWSKITVLRLFPIKYEKKTFFFF
jgi:hypothetical protein